MDVDHKLFGAVKVKTLEDQYFAQVGLLVVIVLPDIHYYYITSPETASFHLDFHNYVSLRLVRPLSIWIATFRWLELVIGNMYCFVVAILIKGDDICH